MAKSKTTPPKGSTKGGGANILRESPSIYGGAPDATKGNDKEASPAHIKDFVSGEMVRATPEELEAVQVFARRLVEDFGYPKEVIRTRPQYRVRASPSASTTSANSYPVDIAVFKDKRRLDEDTMILVECKRKTRHDGETQLKLYLQMSAARIGVWFNGDEHLYLLKKVKPSGGVEWVTLPTIPRWGQDIEDIGKLTREELQPPRNLKAVFRDIRNYLAANTTGATRDQELAREFIAMLFCKIYDEFNTAPKDLPQFRMRVDEAAEKVAGRVHALFDKVREDYSDVFDPDARITLEPPSVIQYVVGELQNYLVTGATRDALGDAFEVFIGPATRGEEGQFFTPRNVVQMMVELLDPRPGETLIDPACGSGGFLVVALEHMWAHLEAEGKAKNWSEKVMERKRVDVASRCIRGIDKDGFLAKLTKAYMALIGDGRGGIFCEDSLEQSSKWTTAKGKVPFGTFDIVVTNPPFGSKIKVAGAAKLAQYDLARKWKGPRGDADWSMTDKRQTDQAPQILFIERCLQLLKPGGRLGIILPESLFGMSNYGYVVKWLLDRCTLRAFISLPEEVFQPYTHAKTCALVLVNTPPPEDYDIEMAIADWCGHDSRGNPTVRINEEGEEVLLDDLPAIAARLRPRLEWES